MMRLGEPPDGFGHTVEKPWLSVEDAPHSSFFDVLPILVESWRVIYGANDRIPTAEVRISLSRVVEFDEPSSSDPGSTDWFLFDGARYVNAEDILGGGRRIQIITARNHPAENWCIFEGFVDRIDKGWSGSSSNKTRWLILFCTSTIAAADREASQFLFGQWRRTRGAEIALRDSGPEVEQRKCLRVTSVPAVFNPDGKRNCNYAPPIPGPNTEDPAFKVWIFNDIMQPPVADAIPWNVARMLRYIQWAALQPQIPIPTDPQSPYDQAVYSNPNGPQSLLWTSFNLAFARAVYDSASGEAENDVGPNLDDLIEPYLSPGAGDGLDPQSEALMRTPANIAINGMTVLEAFIYVCHEAGILCSVEHDTSATGEVFTYLRFTVRGDRCNNTTVPGGVDDIVVEDSEPDGGGGFRSRRRIAGHFCTARAVNLYVSSDRLSAAGSPGLAFRDDGPTEGTIVQDVSSVRERTVAIGAGGQYEVTTTPLVPGWAPDSWWDVNPDDPNATTAANDRVGHPPWNARYGRAAATSEFRHVGRYWVLNEDGLFTAIAYRRQFGAWNTNEAWDPYKWQSSGGIFELAQRGDNYWSTRRRRFLPLIVRELSTNKLIEPFAWLSFNGGTEWWPARACFCEFDFDGERCAIYVRNPHVELVSNPKPNRPASEPANYAEAYIKGLLRVRVTANIEGDDALQAWSPAQNIASVPWVEFVDRSRDLRRTLRTIPGSPALPASAGNPLVVGSDHAPYMLGGNEDDQAEGVRLATRLGRELAVPRFSGACTIPWLWRDNQHPLVAGYRIGDEILGLVSGRNESHWSFTPGRGPHDPAPRIIGMTYSYSEAEQSTSLQIEDRSFGVNDVIGAPGIADANRWT